MTQRAPCNPEGATHDLRILELAAAMHRQEPGETTLVRCDDCGHPLSEVARHDNCAPTLTEQGNGFSVYVTTWGGCQFDLEVTGGRRRHVKAADETTPPSRELEAAVRYLTEWLAEGEEL